MTKDPNVTVVASATLHRLHLERAYLRARLIATTVDYVFAAHGIVVGPAAIGHCLDDELQGLAP